MQSRFTGFLKPFVAAIPLLWMIAACVPGQLSSTLSAPTETIPLAEMTGLASTIRVYQGENLEAELGKDQTISVQPGDSIEVASDGHGELRFQDLLEAELFPNAIVQLADLRLESGGSTSIELRQDQGHIKVSQIEGAPVRLVLVTEDATITTVENPTQFIVCKAPGVVTCLKVYKGATQITAQGKSEYIQEGEASFVEKGKPPSPVICAPNEIFLAWEEQARKSPPTQAVGDLVAALPRQPCLATTPQTASLPGSLGMVNIPEGTYQVGSNEAGTNYAPVQSVQVSNFWIDMYEVTNAQYQQYLDQTGAQAPVNGLGQPDHPVMGVTWDQASVYCIWAKKRLPTEAEWEVAGRGTDSRLFPWGNEPDDGGRILDLPRDGPYRVGEYSFNVSPFGVYDLVGNVWEWVGDPYGDVPAGLHILHGGQFGLIENLAYRHPTAPDDEGLVPVAGLRCAADEVEK